MEIIKKNILNNNYVKIILLLLSVLIGVFSNIIPPRLILFFSLGGLFLILVLNFIEGFLLFAIFIRSSLDALRNIQFTIDPLYLNPASVLSIAIAIGGILYLMIKNIPILTNKVAKAFLIFLVVSFLGIINALNNFGVEGSIAFKEWVRLFSLFILFLLTKNVFKSKEQINKAIKVMFYSLAIPLFFGYFQLVTKPGSIFAREGIPRIFGTLVHPNPYALYLCFFLIITLMFFGLQKKVKYLTLSLLIFIPFMATFSLTGLIMLVTIIIILGMLKYKKLALIGLIIFIIIILSVGPLHNRLSNLKEINIKEELRTGKTTSSFSWRIYWWSLYFRKVKERPVFGYGLHTSVLVNPREDETGIVYAPHNDFLRILIELGIIGLFTYIYFFYVIGRWLWRSYKNIEDKKYKNFALVIFSIFIAFIVGSFAGNFITATVFQYYFWISLGIVSSINSSNEIKKLRK